MCGVGVLVGKVPNTVLEPIITGLTSSKGARGRSGRASGSELIGPRFDSHWPHRVVSFSKAHAFCFTLDYNA